jgi:transcriptional regulator with XRE-family HTH domain
MSDLYLTLRHRLAQVAHDWVEIDGQLLVEARNRKGLSREAFGAQVGVVAKTVERYENQGRVPRALLPRFAEALNLDIQELPPEMISVSRAASTLDDQLALLREELAEVRGMVVRLLRERGETPAKAARTRRPAS